MLVRILEACSYGDSDWAVRFGPAPRVWVVDHWEWPVAKVSGYRSYFGFEEYRVCWEGRLRMSWVPSALLDQELPAVKAFLQRQRQLGTGLFFSEVSQRLVKVLAVFRIVALSRLDKTWCAGVTAGTCGPLVFCSPALACCTWSAASEHAADKPQHNLTIATSPSVNLADNCQSLLFLALLLLPMAGCRCSCCARFCCARPIRASHLQVRIIGAA